MNKPNGTAVRTMLGMASTALGGICLFVLVSGSNAIKEHTGPLTTDTHHSRVEIQDQIDARVSRLLQRLVDKIDRLAKEGR